MTSAALLFPSYRCPFYFVWILFLTVAFLSLVGPVTIHAQNQNVNLNEAGQVIGIIPNATNDPGVPPTIIHDTNGHVPYPAKVIPQSIVALDGAPNLTGTVQPFPSLDEAYVDTFNLALHLGTTDLQVATVVNEIPLAIVRRYHSRVYSSKTGLRPGEDPSKTFGVGWTSSLTPSLHLESPHAGNAPAAPPDSPPNSDPNSVQYQEWLLNSIRYQVQYKQWLDMKNQPYLATATDEYGVRYTFVLDRGMRWIPVASDDFNSSIRGATLTLEGDLYRLTKSTGTTVDYKLIDDAVFVPHNRWASDSNPNSGLIHGVNPPQPNAVGVHHRWARAESVSNGNSSELLNYIYSAPDSFVPSTISHTPSGQSLTITPSTQNASLIGSVADGSGNTVTYTYVQQTHPARHDGTISPWFLSAVQNSDPAATSPINYTFSLSTEQSQDPPPPPKDPALWDQQQNWIDLNDPELSPVEFYHWNVTNLDLAGTNHSFVYDFDHTHSSYFDSPWWKGEFTLTGAFMRVTEVTCPTGTTDFSLDSHQNIVSIQNDLSHQSGGWRNVTVTDPNDVSLIYEFDDITYYRLDTSRDHSVSIYNTPFMVTYDRMTVLEANGTPLVTVVPNVSADLSLILHHFSVIDDDSDGFSSGWENSVGSNPYDTSDFPRVNDPYVADSDGDGYLNALEMAYFGTNPLNTSNYPGAPPGPGPGNQTNNTLPDSDGDGMPDHWEILHGLNPADPSDAHRDDDYDRLDNLTEYKANTIPTVDWDFIPIADGVALESLNERGQLARVTHLPASGEYQLDIWSDGNWTTRAPLGADNLEGDDLLVRHNNHGLAAAIFYQTDPGTGLKANLELRILKPDNTLVAETIASGHTPVLQKITDSGLIYAKYIGDDGYHKTLVWDLGSETLATHELADGHVELLDGNERGELIATENASDPLSGIFWDGTTWAPLDGHPVALNNHGQVLVSKPETTGGTTTIETYIWNASGQSIPTGITLQGDEQARLNDRDQFVIHGSGGYAPVFVDPDAGPTTITLPADTDLTDPWILVTGLNDMGEVAGNFYDPDATGTDPAYQGFSWHMGSFLFNGIYDDSSVHALTNSGFLSIGAREQVSEEEDFDGDGIPDQTTDSLKTRLGILAPQNDLDKNSLPDDWETYHNVTDPAGDPDNDNLPNWAEYIHFTNPNVSDSDFDAFSDGSEVSTGTDPSWSNDGDLTSDIDGDNLTLNDELFIHGTNPGLTDSDHDGLDDDFELANNLNPTLEDTDHDGVNDGVEIANGTDPTQFDPVNDSSGAEHLIAAFAPGDGRPAYSSPLGVDIDGDRDGMPDDWEDQHGLNPDDPEDAWRDFDYDRIINRAEYERGSMPNTDWTFVEIEGGLDWNYMTQNWRGTQGPAGYEGLLGDGALRKVTPTGTVTKWNGENWVGDGSLGSGGGFNGVSHLVANEMGQIAAVFGNKTGPNSSGFTSCELRIKDLDGNVHVVGGGEGWKNVPKLWITESGFVAGVALKDFDVQGNTLTKEMPFRWRNGTLETFDHPDVSPDGFEPIGISERGEFLDRERGILQGEQWLALPGGHVGEAIGMYGELWSITDPSPDPLTQYTGPNGKWVNRRGDRLAGIVRRYPFTDETSAHPISTFLGGNSIPWSLTGLGAFDNRFAGTSDTDGDGWTDNAEQAAGTSASNADLFPGRNGNGYYRLFVAGMNDLGDVIGWRRTPETAGEAFDQKNQAILWRYRDFSILGGLGDESRFWAINNSGHILVSKTEHVPETTPQDIDGDGITDYEMETGNVISTTTWGILVPNNDSDGNGLPDDWETLFGVTDPTDDPDLDSLSNQMEYILGTHPKSKDTDQDGISDKVELAFGSNPLSNTLSDHDFDGDGIDSSIELQTGTDPLTYNQFVENPLDDDDFDGLTNNIEATLQLDPLQRDSDGDGVIDSMEIYADGTDPLDPLSLHDYGIQISLRTGSQGTALLQFQNTLGREISFTIQSPNQSHISNDRTGNPRQWLSFPTGVITVAKDGLASISLNFNATNFIGPLELYANLVVSEASGLILDTNVSMTVESDILTSISLVPNQSIRRGQHLNFSAISNAPIGINLEEIRFMVNGESNGFVASDSSPTDFQILIEPDAEETIVVTAFSVDSNGREGPFSNEITLNVPLSTDGDQLPDEWEITMIINDDTTDNLTVIDDVLEGDDYDGDNLDNLTEFLIGTDPANPDTDGDLIDDGFEHAANLDPNDRSDAHGDLDNDGITNLAEFLAGSPINNPDADNDQMFDGWEALHGVSDPAADPDGDGFTNLQSFKPGPTPGIRMTTPIQTQMTPTRTGSWM